MTNITNKDGVLTATEEGTGTIVWHMKVPFQFIGGNLAAAGDGYAFELGFTDPKDWKTTYTALAALAEFDGKFKDRTAMGNEYWIKCTLTGNASLIGVRIKNDIQMASLAMPSMTVGNNRFTYLEHTDDKTGANAARNVRITHSWVERSKTRPPESARIANISGQWRRERRHGCGVSVERRHGPRRRVHHGSSFPAFGPSRHEMALSPNFDKYISKTPDKGNARYTLPRPGLLTHGTTYYWHVKAKDSNGVWGPWSDTWSFTAQGPAYPINLAIKHNPTTGIGTLTWSANPAGRPPAKYRVYGSDEKGFTVHDTPYEVNLGDTKDFANPFPANFVAEVKALPWMLWAWATRSQTPTRPITVSWRWTARTREAGIRIMSKPLRPFIYSAPVTSAPAGQPYRYQVKAIRSLGDLTRRDAAKPKPGIKFWKIDP